MVLARLLTPEEFGIAAAAGFFTLLAGRLSELGFNAAIVRSKDDPADPPVDGLRRQLVARDRDASRR